MKTNNLQYFFGMLLMSLASQRDDLPKFRGFAIGGYNPIFIPRRREFKGYMRENRRFNSFNKKKL